VPQVRALAGWRSVVRAALDATSEELERLAVETYAPGLSMRDIEAAFADARGRRVASRSAARRRPPPTRAGPRAGAIRGGAVGSPGSARTSRTVAATAMKATIRI